MGGHQIAHWLRTHGYTVRVIDFCYNLGPERIAELTLNWMSKETIAVGVSSTWWSSPMEDTILRVNRLDAEPSWVKIARRLVEEKNKTVKWILGGANSTSKNTSLEWIRFHNHPEDEIVRWADSQSGKFKLRKPFDITTLSHRFVEDDCIAPFEALPIELGRGCKFKCKFCQYPLIGKKPGTYLRNINCIKDEILYNYERWGTTKYLFLDDTVNEDEDKIKNLADLMQSLPFELSWVGFNRADLIYARPHTAQWLIDSGMKSCFFGIESFHREGSMLVGKGWSGKHGKEWLPKLRHDIWKDRANFTLAFIIGLEPEVEEDVYQTHRWCIDNKMSDWTWAPLYIRNIKEASNLSEFEKNAQDYGYNLIPNQLHRWESKNWTTDKATKLYHRLLQLAKFERTFSGWHLMETASVGYEINDIMNKSLGLIQTKSHKEKCASFLDDYFYKLQNLK
jgi:radical SAM superfamily enzyme YgiQ (UPF0313 family)